jgi:GntR family transcriptional regulator
VQKSDEHRVSRQRRPSPADRVTLATEADRLKIRPGASVLTIARIYYTDQRPVETADIILPVERYSLVYEIPVR